MFLYYYLDGNIWLFYLCRSESVDHMRPAALELQGSDVCFYLFNTSCPYMFVWMYECPWYTMFKYSSIFLFHRYVFLSSKVYNKSSDKNRAQDIFKQNSGFYILSVLYSWFAFLLVVFKSVCIHYFGMLAII